jgi:hypothetical protein
LRFVVTPEALTASRWLNAPYAEYTVAIVSADATTFPRESNARAVRYAAGSSAMTTVLAKEFERRRVTSGSSATLPALA